MRQLLYSAAHRRLLLNSFTIKKDSLSENYLVHILRYKIVYLLNCVSLCHVVMVTGRYLPSSIRAYRGALSLFVLKFAVFTVNLLEVGRP